jgi:hypothetical protein
MAVATIVVGPMASFADDSAQNAIYIGGGSAQTNDILKSSSAPYSVGYVRLSNEKDIVWGVDVAGEGTLLDSTWGKNKAVKQSTSFNLLLGQNLIKTENGRFDATVILGLRNSFTSCPSSYLGYQCYADQAPSTKYDFNYGALLSYSYKSLLVGLRATGESSQVVIGYRF